MKSLLRLAARLYPRSWRDRYGREFDALLDDLTPRWGHVFNIVTGAFIMQMSRPVLVPVVLAVAGGLAGAALSLAMPPVYASSSWVLVQVAGTAADSSERGQRIKLAIDAALQRTALDKQAVGVTLRGEPGLEPVMLEVSASADSAEAAQRAAERAMGSLIEANLVVSERTPGAAPERQPGVQFRAVQPAGLPTTARRDVARNSALGSGLGFVVGAGIAILAYRRRRPAA